MSILKKIGKGIKKYVKNGLHLADKIWFSGPVNWAKDHKKELATYAAIVGGGAAGGYLLAGAGAGAAGTAAGTTGAGAGTTGAVGAGTTAATLAKASASGSMWPWLAASIGTSGVNAYMQNRANQQALAWQQYVTNNAHRIEVADLMSAGLNPAASANQGAGGGAYNPMAAQFENPIVAAMQIKQLEEQTKQIEEQTKQTQQETAIRQPEALKALQDIKYLQKHNWSALRNTPHATKEQIALAAGKEILQKEKTAAAQARKAQKEREWEEKLQKQKLKNKQYQSNNVWNTSYKGYYWRPL